MQGLVAGLLTIEGGRGGGVYRNESAPCVTEVLLPLSHE